MLADDIAEFVRAEISRQLRPQSAVGTVVSSPSAASTDPMMVILDGSATAVQVKLFRGFPVFPGMRVGLVKLGADWAVVGALSNPGLGSGTTRMVIGADTPAELAAFGIDVAILSYIRDKTSGLEVGYFWIGTSNRFDGAGDNRVQAFGNVVYPIPGNPASATVSNVKTNFQQNMNSPYPQTIFKDQEVVMWTNFKLDIPNGATKADFVGPSGVITARIDSVGVHAGQPSVADTVETWHACSLQNSWANFGSPFVTAKYRKIASPPNSVELIGVITNGTATSGTVLFNLPAGYRPSNQQRHVVYMFGGTLNISTETPALDVKTNGDVTYTGPSNATVITFHFTVPLDA